MSTPTNPTHSDLILTPSGRKFIKLLRKAVKYHTLGDPVKDVINENDLIEGVEFLLGILDERCAGWDTKA